MRNDEWVTQLDCLNNRFREFFGDERIGNRDARRSLLTERVGPIRRLRRLDGGELAGFLNGRGLVGVDGSVNTFGGSYPHYVDFFRAMAKPSAGAPIVIKHVHAPFPSEENPEAQRRNDQEVRQQLLAELEVRAALEAVGRLNPAPALVVMDGPLVRFDMRARKSFARLCDAVTKGSVLLTGCIENIESRVISALLGDQAPAGWRNRYDSDLLWDTLEPGEVLEVSCPAKGLGRALMGEEGEPAAPIRTWFMRPSLAPGVVGLEMLEEQAGRMGQAADYLYTLTPQDGRGIPVWIDIVDREVRLTDVELEAYLDLLDPQLKRLFAAKREARIY